MTNSLVGCPACDNGIYTNMYSGKEVICPDCSGSGKVEPIKDHFTNLEGKAEIYINLEGHGINAIGIRCEFRHIKALLECQGAQVGYVRIDDSLVEDWYESFMGEIKY